MTREWKRCLIYAVVVVAAIWLIVYMDTVKGLLP